ncbi:hypothetical protein Pelo_6969 [Pelomyxa schiedti]|nr:hypothetical protein Pelo_6969 [Pelomyxa schiedti]
MSDTSEDPYFALQEEIQESLDQMLALCEFHRRSCREGSSDDQKEGDICCDATTRHINDTVHHVEEELELLQQTIGIVEANRLKYRTIDDQELAQRKEFLATSRETLQRAKREMGGIP